MMEVATIACTGTISATGALRTNASIADRDGRCFLMRIIAFRTSSDDKKF